MRILIDGYNLINATGIPPAGVGIGSLERARLGLFHFLTEKLEPGEIVRTTVVFDSHHAPPGLPRVTEYHGLVIRFAAGYDTADTLIEELIAADSSPRQLTVVSSDHRIQRAAHRRKAIAIDSESWHAELVRRPPEQGNRPKSPPSQPAGPMPETEVQAWVEEFGGEEIVEEVLKDERTSDLANPFPPGYAEDLT